jgi:hypothetical protein
MKKPIFLIISLFVLIIIGLTGCEKDKYDYTIKGKWKFQSALILMGDGKYLQGYTITIDSLKNDIIYEFQKNNILIVTSSISENLQTNAYFYKCKKRSVFCGSLDYDDIEIKIGKNIYYGSVSQKYERISLFSGVKPQKPIDEIDLILIEQDSLAFWQKEFIKLK